MLKELIDIEEARGLVLDRVAPLPAEEVPLREALGRVLADDVDSAEPIPPFDNSAMDGFAVRAADTHGAAPGPPVTLRITGESRAGAPAAMAVEEGEAIRISTGAMMPEGSDAVVRVEDTTARGGRVEVAVEVAPSHNVRSAGEDVKPGDPVLRRGMVLGSAELGVLSSVGWATVRCTRRPRVAVLTTGDELLEPGEEPRLGAIRNANAYSLPAVVQQSGGELAAVESVGDEPGLTREAIGRALEADMAVICGGVSVGEHDHVRPALVELGTEEIFWGVALRPGKPTWFGIGERGGLAFGLPGNPVSAIVTFLLLARPALLALQGADPSRERTTAILVEPYEKKPGRAHAVRCRLRLGEDGWHARSTGPQGSHVLTSMLGADGLAIIPTESGSVAAGERVTVELLPSARPLP